MILGTEARRRPMVELVESAIDIDLSEQPAWPAARQRDGGHFLTPRLYPTAAFDAWQPVSSYVTTSEDGDEDPYALASESM